MAPGWINSSSASGVASSQESARKGVRSLRAIGADAVLVGETLMRAADKTQKLNELRGI